MKYKVGDILKVKEDSRSKCENFENHKNSKYIKITDLSLNNYSYEILDSKKDKIVNCSYCLNDSHLEPITKTLENLEEGDILLKKNYPVMVLGVCGKAIFISLTNKYKQACGSAFTVEELQTNGYTIKQEAKTKEIKEMTIKEICDKLGYEVKIKKE